MTRGLSSICALVAFSASAFGAGARGDLPTKAEIDTILRGLSGITGFRIHRQLPFEMVTRDQVNRFLKDQIRETVKSDDIHAEEITLKKFGLVPPDFDLKQNTIDLLTEQAAAFYDFRRKKLFISDWASRNMRDEALVHELAHALADQNFSIRKYLAGAKDNSEAYLARESVVEGQASWLMLEYEARHAGRSLADPQVARELLREGLDSEDSSYPVFSHAPLYVRASLMFPYEDGGRFQQALFIRDPGAAFAQPFETPPANTAQVIHPDRYFAHTAPAAPALPKRSPDARELVSGAMGELDHRVLLRQYLGAEAAASLAPKLLAAAYRIDNAGSKPVYTLTYRSDWEDASAAAEYFTAYRRILSQKWKNMKVAAETASEVSGQGDDGYFELRVDGSAVLSREGFSAPLSAAYPALH